MKGIKVAVDMQKFQNALKRKKLHSKSPEDHAAIKLLEEGEGGGLVQVRGTLAKGQDKRRITVMPRLYLHNVVQGLKKRLPPKGSLGAWSPLQSGLYRL